MALALIALGIGLIVLFFAKRKAFASIIESAKAACWLLVYFLGLTTISYFGSFGGKNDIPFGWDFVVIALFSFLIFQFSVKCSRFCKEIDMHTLSAKVKAQII